MLKRPKVPTQYPAYLRKIGEHAIAEHMEGMETVVRCRDCKHRANARECPMCYTEDSYDEEYGYDYWDVDKTTDDGFCHCGEKWNEEGEVNDG